jgi:hypothetical protein
LGGAEWWEGQIVKTIEPSGGLALIGVDLYPKLHPLSFLSTSEESPSSSCLERPRAKQYTLDLHLTQEGQEIIREAPSRMIKKGQVTLSPFFPPSPSAPPTTLAPPSQTPQNPPAPQTSFSTHSHRINRRMRIFQPHLPLSIPLSPLPQTI